MNSPFQGSLSEYLGRNMAALAQEVQSESPNDLLNQNEAQYIDYLVRRYRVDPLALHLDAVTASASEQMIEASRHPRSDFAFPPGEARSFRRQVITYHIPFSGDANLLHSDPMAGLLSSIGAEVQRDRVCFDIIDFRHDTDDVNRRSQHSRQQIREQADSVNRAVDEHNRQLEANATRLVCARKEEIRQRIGVLAALDVPVRQRDDVPSAFAVPVHRVPLVIEKPQAPAEPYKPDPRLPQAVYDAILRIIHDLGVEMERHPSMYAGKDEEALRDVFLVFLAPHFHSATGETFNKSGRTDILIRHEGSNAFVAGCKFWDGAKRYHDAIDQLLGCLTWRDSKAAILFFVKAKELTPVLAKIGQETPNHPCFVKDRGERSESWHDYEFHLPGDPSRPVSVAVLSFHLPE